MYKARKGKGAFCNDDPIQVSDVKGNMVIFVQCAVKSLDILFCIFENATVMKNRKKQNIKNELCRYFSKNALMKHSSRVLWVKKVTCIQFGGLLDWYCMSVCTFTVTMKPHDSNPFSMLSLQTSTNPLSSLSMELTGARK